MNRTSRMLVVALAALALAGCSKNTAINAPPLSSGSADFSVVAAIGTSVSAGFESGGLVVHHQQKAFPYAFARQVGFASFTFPAVSAAGIPPLLYIQSFSPLAIDTTGRARGAELNATQTTAFHNMSVPRSILPDVTSSALYGRNPDTALMFDIVVRGRGTILSEVLSLNPTFVTFEMGANEVLGPATNGQGAPAVPPAVWAGALTATMNALVPPGSARKVAIFTVPDVTSIPYVTTISPRLDPAGVCRVLGTGGPLTDNDYVMLEAAPMLAAGRGVPSLCGGTGVPLPDSVVLLAANAASMQAATDQYNTAIDTVALRPNVVKVDLNGLLRQAATTGFSIQGQLYTSEYVTGGLFSLDGIHPTDLAHGLICNALIDAVNAKFGARIAHVNLGDFATATSSRAEPAGVSSGLPLLRGFRNPLEAHAGWRGVLGAHP